MAYACSDARTHTHTHTKCKHQCTRTLYNLPYINNTHTHSHTAFKHYGRTHTHTQIQNTKVSTHTHTHTGPRHSGQIHTSHCSITVAGNHTVHREIGRAS